MIQKFPAFLERQAPMLGASPCEHRTVSKDGRIICKKIMVGDNGVSPNECRACPFRAVNCQHLRFSLQQTSPRPLVVRYNGREEVWDDDPAELRFEQGHARPGPPCLRWLRAATGGARACGAASGQAPATGGGWGQGRGFPRSRGSRRRRRLSPPGRRSRPAC
jgi:hypothetical protein